MTPEVRGSAAWCPDHLNVRRFLLIGGPEAARAFGNQDAGHEWVEAGRLKKLRSEMRARSGRDDDKHIVMAQHRRKYTLMPLLQALK